MKMTSSWFLLALSMTQWVGGHVCLEISYWIEIQRQMSAQEQALAAIVQQKTGIESAVRVLSEDELMPRGNFYGDFVFLEKTEAKTIYYTVENQSYSTVYKALSQAHDQKTPISNGPSEKLLKGLFKVFEMQDTQWPALFFQKRLTPAFQYTTPLSFLFKPLMLHPPAQA
jgi:hypothetical protein